MSLAALRGLRSYWQQVFRRVDQVGVRIFAASIAYRAIFAAVSFASTIMSILWLLGTDPEGQFSTTLFRVLPPDVADIATARIDRALELGSNTIATAGAVGLILGIWGLAGGFMAICDVLDRVHQTHRYQKMSRRYARAVMIASGFVLLIALAAVLLILGSATGKRVLDLVGLELFASVGAEILRITLIGLFTVAAFIGVLRWGSHARPPWLEVVAGGAIAASAWLLLTLGFTVTVRQFDAFEAYGAIATAVGLLFYGYALAWIIILCAFAGPFLASVTRWIFRRGRVDFRLLIEPESSPDHA